MPLCYFGISADTTLANIVNVETIISDPPSVLPDQSVPLLGSVKRRALSGKARRDGAITSGWRFTSLRLTDARAFIYYVLSNYTTAGKQVAISSIDEIGYYSPYLAFVDKPQVSENYQIDPGGDWLVNVDIPLFGLQLQSATYATTHTITSAERLIYANTTSAGFTLTLPSAAGVNANTIYSVQKTAAANTLTIARAGTDTIDGTTSIALTANHGRYDMYSDGTSAWVSL